MNRSEANEEYMIKHKDEFKTLDYANINTDYYEIIFNGKYSNMDFEANALEGWINIFVINSIEKLGKFDVPRSYFDKNCKPITLKLYGEVIIFELDPKTLDFIEK